MDIKELKKILEEEYAWGNLDAENNKWFLDELLEDFLDILKKQLTLTDVVKSLKGKETITYEQYRDFIYTKDRNKYINKETQMPTYEDEIELRYEWHLKNL